MQLARMHFGLDTRSPFGKLVQAARALQLERHYTKADILEAYLNLAPYGGSVKGIGTASCIYFDKPAPPLSRGEALALAVIPQNPTARFPATRRPCSATRRTGTAADGVASLEFRAQDSRGNGCAHPDRTRIQGTVRPPCPCPALRARPRGAHRHRRDADYARSGLANRAGDHAPDDSRCESSRTSDAPPLCQSRSNAHRYQSGGARHRSGRLGANYDRADTRGRMCSRNGSRLESCQAAAIAAYSAV